MSILKDIYIFFFGKDYGAIWRQFSDRHHGKFIVGQCGISDSVEIEFKKHKIIFDRYIHYQNVGGGSNNTEFTRVRLEFVPTQDINFCITNQGFFSRIAKFMGSQDIEIGDPAFDKKFMIKGNNELLIQSIFSNQSIKELLLSQEDVQLQTLANEGIFDEPIQEGKMLLYYISETPVRNVEQLESLFSLFQVLIMHLTKSNSMK